MILKGSFWSGRRYHLDKMSMRDLLVIFYQYPAILTYHALFLACAAGVLSLRPPLLPALFWVAVSSLSFSFSWYVLHRFLLQSSLLYRFRTTAVLWKRVHYDHHRDPNDLRVLFGALPTTLPPMLLFAGVVWLVSGNLGHALAFLGTSLALTVWSEFCHCVQHLAIDPKLDYFRRIKKLHLIHHFQNEKVYYGITNFFWDRLLGTYPKDPKEVRSSETVFNLGYDSKVEERYPWVRELTGRT